MEIEGIPANIAVSIYKALNKSKRNIDFEFRQKLRMAASENKLKEFVSHSMDIPMKMNEGFKVIVNG